MNDTPTPFPDPYESLPMDQQHRTSIVTDKRVWAAINSCRGHRGTLQVTINILLKKLHEQLEQNGLTSYDPKRYEHAILNARLELADAPRSAEPSVPPETPHRNESGGTSDMVHENPRCGNESADFGSPSPNRPYGQVIG